MQERPDSGGRAGPATAAVPMCFRWPARLTALVLCGFLFAALIAVDHRLYDHFDFQVDYGIFAQAWYLISHGHPAPVSTFKQYPFLEDHFELAMWPLSTLASVVSDSEVLLVVQDLAIAGCVYLTFSWSLELAERRWSRGLLPLPLAVAIPVVVLIGFGTSPGVFWTAWNNVHLQPEGTLFLVLCARQLWRGSRVRTVLPWVACGLLFGDQFALYFVALGLAAIVRRPRHPQEGIMVVVCGVTWFFVVAAFGFGRGDLVGTNFAYLARGARYFTTPTGLRTESIGSILSGLVHHPSVPLHVLSLRKVDVARQLWYGGLLGIVSPWGLLAAIATTVPASLNQLPSFIDKPGSFNIFAAYPVLWFGTAQVLAWLVRARLPWRRWKGDLRVGVLLATGAAAAVLASTCVVDMPVLASVARFYQQTPPSSAPALTTALHTLSPSTEVISSQWVVGRFSQRSQVYPIAPGVSTPIVARHVAIVFATFGTNYPQITGAVTTADIAFVQHTLGAQELVRADGVTVFMWDAPSDVKSLTWWPVPVENLRQPRFVSIAVASTGYWVADQQGLVVPELGAHNYGSVAGVALNSPIVQIVATADGRGYWEVGEDGGVYAFGDAKYLGGLGGRTIAAPVIGMAPTPDDRGYWLVESNGTSAAFGDAPTVAPPAIIASPAVAVAADPDSAGYWIATASGQVIPAGAPAVANSGARGTVAIAAAPGGRGYALVTSSGQISACASGASAQLALPGQAGVPVTSMADRSGDLLVLNENGLVSSVYVGSDESC